jgi:host factor-I protein
MSDNNGKKPLQETFLNELRKNKTSVSVFMVNGIKLNGQIVSFDQFSILLGGKTDQLIYKQKISTIVPAGAAEHKTKSHY